MMKKILFISRMPDEINIVDGMMQRIEYIDSLHVGFEKYYLNLHTRILNFRIKKRSVDGITEYKCNSYYHLFFIISLILKYDYVLVHSIYHFNNITFHLKLLKMITFLFRIKKPVFILDIHGVVPEELAYLNQSKRSDYYSSVEKTAFLFCDKLIFLNIQMLNHYELKYPSIEFERKRLIISMISSNVLFSQSKKINMRQVLGIKETATVVIYCGNIAKWQNIDIILDAVKGNQDENIFYIILSHSADWFKEQLKDCRNIYINRVDPSEVKNYYAIANYGFILRDNNILNLVSGPAKLLEYLFFGIIPIVMNSELGDISEYDYVSINDYNAQLKAVKSKVNIKIAQEYIKKVEKMKIDY